MKLDRHTRSTEVVLREIWRIAPDQVRVLPVTEQQIDYAQGIVNELRAQQVRVEMEFSNDKLMGRIQRTEEARVHHILVVGQREQETIPRPRRSSTAAPRGGEAVQSASPLSAQHGRGTRGFLSAPGGGQYPTRSLCRWLGIEQNGTVELRREWGGRILRLHNPACGAAGVQRFPGRQVV